ncbi:FAD-binding oxidoreductase [Pacificimonas sp. WHA3]|uniref:FAD-binding oxidoreductase n=1 Tax=Pacificimonas pallii TaxID=2827236 RepID=A0ABS6SFR1_9SPHN|nr:FAD-binding oxidoreductase [Pacificimonas pallii]MBV7257239.1 FAD-binding oxidoreductase [Pacificimonas pallii]
MNLSDIMEDFQHCVCEGGRVITVPEEMAAYLTDWRGNKTGHARMVLQPGSTESLARIVRLAAQTGTALVPQGGNTGLVGGSVPETDGNAILVSMTRMNRIRSVDPASDCIIAEAGVILQHVHEAAAAADRMFPLSLGAKGSATIGGLVSTNAGGTQVLRYGTMRAQILGLEAVLPSGEVLDQLSPLRKDNSGYDIKQLLIGAEGTLGFVTAASLRLLPAPKTVVTALVGLTDPAAALGLMTRLKPATGDRLDSFELMPRIAVELVTQHVPGTRDPLEDAYPWYVLMEVTSSVAGDALHDALEAALAAELAANRILDAVIARSERERGELWQLRETIAEAEKADGKALKHDISIPVADMPRFMAAAAAAIEDRWEGAQVFAFGHLGDGNVHFNVRSDARLPRERLMLLRDDVAALVYRMVADHRGSISAEHGIGSLKAGELAQLGDPGKLAAMKAVKAALDPMGIMNPGKMFV